jgi:dihydrofolate synthase/folylpolyglutamate synthase
LRAIDQLKIGHAAYEGIVNAEWPARMQRLSSGKLIALGPAGCEIWLDGGHNADGGRVAAAALGDLEERVSRPLVVIAGMMGNKDAGAFLANFAGLTRHIFTVEIPGQDNAMPQDRLAAAARALGMRVEIAGTVRPCARSQNSLTKCRRAGLSQLRAPCRTINRVDRLRRHARGRPSPIPSSR